MSVLSKLKNKRKANRDYVDKQMEKIKSFFEKLPASPSDEDMEMLESDLHVLFRKFKEIKKLDGDIVDVILGDDETADLSKETEETSEFERRVYDTARKIERLAWKTKEQNHSSAGMQTQEKRYNNEAGMQTRGKRWDNQEADGFPLMDVAMDILKDVAHSFVNEVVAPSATEFIKNCIFPKEGCGQNIKPKRIDRFKKFEDKVATEFVTEKPFPGGGWKQNTKQCVEAPLPIGLPPSFQEKTFPGVGWKQSMKQPSPVQIGLPPSFEEKTFPGVGWKQSMKQPLPVQIGLRPSFEGVGWKQSMKPSFEAPVQIDLTPSFPDQFLRHVQEGPKLPSSSSSTFHFQSAEFKGLGLDPIFKQLS